MPKAEAIRVTVFASSTPNTAKPYLDASAEFGQLLLLAEDIQRAGAAGQPVQQNHAGLPGVIRAEPVQIEKYAMTFGAQVRLFRGAERLKVMAYGACKHGSPDIINYVGGYNA